MGRLAKGGVEVVECRDRGFCTGLERDGYLSGGVITPLEAAYQCIAGGLELEGVGGGWGCGLRVVSGSGIWLPLFLVYLDLRRRGRKPKLGVRDNTLWVAVGGKRLEFLVVEEGGLLSLDRLGGWSRLAAGDGYTPILAIVDRLGGVVYYEARVVESLS